MNLLTRWLLSRWYRRAEREAADLARLLAPYAPAPDDWWEGDTTAERTLWDTAPPVELSARERQALAGTLARARRGKR